MRFRRTFLISASSPCSTGPSDTASFGVRGFAARSEPPGMLSMFFSAVAGETSCRLFMVPLIYLAANGMSSKVTLVQAPVERGVTHNEEHTSELQSLRHL